MVGYNQVPDATGIEVNRGHAAEVFPLSAVYLLNGRGPA
jgi:hypothetical protein